MRHPEGTKGGSKMRTWERTIWIIIVIILASGLTFVGLSGKQINDKVDWIEGRQMELRQQVSDLDHILSDFDKIEERIEGKE